MKNIKEKLELEQNERRRLNKLIVFGNKESFISHIKLFEHFNFDISHYKQTYNKAKEYLRNKK